MCQRYNLPIDAADLARERRDTLGRVVYLAWVENMKKLAKNPDDVELPVWTDLTESDRDIYRGIGITVAYYVQAGG